MKTVRYVWDKVLSKTPVPQKIDLRAVEMRIAVDNYDDAEALSDGNAIKHVVDIKGIFFVSAFNKQIKGKNASLLHLKHLSALKVRNTLEEIKMSLDDSFFKISRSAIVNLRKTHSLDQIRKTCRVKDYELKVSALVWVQFASAWLQFN